MCITFNEMTNYIERLVKEVYETQLIAKQSQIQYLQAQMDPHFLFNVLSMIEMKAAMNELEKNLEMSASFKNMEQCAHYYYDAIVPAMDHLREPADKLELLVDKSYWPFPCYGDMIFEV